MLAERRIQFHEPYSVLLRFEAFNAFNHVQFSGLNTVIGSSSFGSLSPTQANSPRSLQASVRVAF
jgi:hypothetical protein